MFCPNAAVVCCSHWQGNELHMIQNRTAAAKLRVPKALRIPLAVVKSELAQSSSSPNCRWLSSYFRMTICDFSSFSEKFPPQRVSRIFSLTSSTICKAISLFHGVASGTSPKTSLEIFGWVFFFDGIFFFKWALHTIRDRAQIDRILESAELRNPNKWCNRWPMFDDR